MLQLPQVLASYQIGEVTEVGPAGGTAGKCWRVTTGAGRYFLRCRGPRTSSPKAMEFDHGLRRHLLARGVPTAVPIATRSGETWVGVNGRAFELYPFIEGRRFGGSLTELTETALALAGFHQAAAGYPARGSYSPSPAQFAIAASAVGGSDRLDDIELILAAFEQIASGEPAMRYAVEQAGRLVEAYSAAAYQALPRWLIHGDYHPGNLLYADSGKVAGIFDLDWACEHTRSRDLADAVYFFATPRSGPLDDSRIESLTDAAEPDLDRARLFLQAYRQVSPVTPVEAHAIPLALAARWLAMRLEGSAKVPADRRVWFITRDLERPLQWLALHAEELVGSVL